MMNQTMNNEDPKFCDDRGWIVNAYKWEATHYCFWNGLGGVKANGKWGFIDQNGKLVIPCVWDEIGHFTEGLAPVKSGDKWGYIDQTGAVVCPLQWECASDFYPGIGNYAVVQQNGLYGLIDLQGKLVIPCQWKLIGYYYEKRWIMVCSDRSGPKAFWVWHHYDLETGRTLESMNNDEDGYGRELIEVL